MVSVSFHVRHEVRPDRVLDTLQALETSAPLDHITQVERQLARARALGLAQQGVDELTDSGTVTMRVVRNRPSLWGEIGHFLHYTLWSEREPDLNAPLFLYRTYCDYLFEQTSGLDASRAELERTCVELANAIESDPRFSQHLDGRLSLSPDSLRGILNWLETLRPPVLEDGVFQRRDFCAPELMLMAIGYVMRDELDAVDIDILLSHNRRDDICKVCLLDPAAFDQALDWAISMYPTIIVSSEEAGYYGRYVRLLKRPALEDFLG